jgi:RNA polymerase sigma factor (sigma-70 family)
MFHSDFDSILAAARAGGEWAWASIYDELAPTLRGYLMSRGAAEPDDLVGEVFLQVVRDLSTFDGSERDFRSWVFTIAHHRLLDEARARTRRPHEPRAHEDLGEALGLGHAEEEALIRLGVQRILGLIHQLSSDQQDVLLLRVIADLSIEEIGRIVGKRPGAVKALQRRGLANLRKEMLAQGVSL